MSDIGSYDELYDELYLFSPLPADKEEFYNFILENKLVPETINEAYEFTREGKPFDKLHIGHQEILKQKADKIPWDWNFEDFDWVHQRPHHEKIMDIIWIQRNHKNFPIKICEIFDDIRKLSIGFYADSVTGEPYSSDGPEIYKNPTNALEAIKDLIYKITIGQ